MPDDPFVTCLMAAGSLMIWQDSNDPDMPTWYAVEVPADGSDWVWAELDVYGDFEDADEDPGHAVIPID